MNIKLVALLPLALAACLTEPLEEPARPDQVTTDLTGDHGAAIQPDEARLITIDIGAACLEHGCPDGLTCDWVQGCVEQAELCCADEQCGEGRFCDFDAGGLCTDLPGT